MLAKSWVGVMTLLPLAMSAQTQPDWKEILNRLERLEKQNAELITEIRDLRVQLGAQKSAPIAEATMVAPAAQEPTVAAPLEDRMAVTERRVDEQEQSKVSSEHRLPLSLTGMLLFNAYLNGRASADQQYPTTASPTPGVASFGGSVRQTVIGMKVRGPEIPGGGHVNGYLYLDFFGGAGTTLNQVVRFRVANLSLDWKDTSVSVGVDKPIIAPREPESLAQVGVSPLTGAGNLWLWQPQVRVEQRFRFGSQTGLRAQLGLYQTAENGTGVPTDLRDTLDRSRPGYEGRFAFWRGSESRTIEIAPGFHVSDSHLLGKSVPSRIFSIDWLIRPVAQFDFSGAFYNGENVGVLGGLRQGITVFPGQDLRPIHAEGGWAQFAWRPTQRLGLHLYGGQENDRGSDLLRGAVRKNQVYAANAIYRLGLNVLASFEASQTRTTYLGTGTRLNPHYDLSLAYLF